MPGLDVRSLAGNGTLVWLHCETLIWTRQRETHFGPTWVARVSSAHRSPLYGRV